MSLSIFSVKWVGLKKLRNRIRRVGVGVASVFSKGEYDKYLVDRVKSRFAPVGTTDTAQISPTGFPWARPHPGTMRRRKGNRQGFNQALVAEGFLLKSIKTLEGDSDQSSVQFVSKRRIRIGVAPSSKAYKYAAVHQRGGKTPQGAVIAARPYMGFSDADIKYIDKQTRKGLFNALRGR